MGIQLQDISTIDSTSYPYVFESNVSVPLKSGGLIRCNVYRPKFSDSSKRFPVIATLGPYGKDVPYQSFNAPSFSEVNTAHQTEHSAWETPTPSYWTDHGYVVVRADEAGIGQSPGLMDILSSSTVDSFCDLIEWAAEQPWSTGRVGLLGISYYAGMQWPVAARNPKGLAACVPWEGFSDLYEEACRHGGILSNTFFDIWFPRQVTPNQYGLPGKAARNWGPDTIEGDLSEDELKTNRITDPSKFNQYKYRDDDFFARMDYDLQDVKVPFLSVANWGGIKLHLRGNVRAFVLAGSEFKYLRFIAGRHDLPFYYSEEVELQRSFLDAFLKDADSVGWKTQGKVPAVDLVLRKGNVGVNDPLSEATFLRRAENEWPLARTQYTDFFLTQDKRIQLTEPNVSPSTKLTYTALEGTDSSSVSFQTEPFSEETEITGHIVAHLNVSVSQGKFQTAPSNLDMFVSLRHIFPDGEEVLYTGSTGEGVPATGGFLRLSLRKTNPHHPHHRPWSPRRDYYSTDVLPVNPHEVYAVDVELWPTNVVIEAGGKLLFEISSEDAEIAGLWHHTDAVDRSEDEFRGLNHIHFGPDHVNFLRLPIIPPKH